MFVLGITGGSGSGKSTICNMFKSKGFYVIDSDKIARDIVKPNMPALLEIKKTFGDEYINADGELDRKKLGAFVFSNPDMLEKLTKITHKYIIEDISKKIKNSDSNLVLIDAPLLHKAGLEKLCNLTVAVTAPISVRIERIMKRDNLSFSEAENRINSQVSDEEYCAFCDFTVSNDKNTDLNETADLIYKKVQGEI